VLFALRHPEVCRGLLLWRVTGGRFACERLAVNYYQQYIDAARAGGMKAVCALEHFKERCEAKPSNRDYLMRLDPKRFIDVMARWKKSFDESANLPIIGASESDLRSIKVPTVVIPGNDRTHGTATGKLAASLIPQAELHLIWEKDEDSDLTPAEWAVMKLHPITGENICKPLHSLRPVLPIIRYHHEHSDGSGYPDGLMAADIPVLPRVLQVVDVYDALRTARSYKPALSHEQAAQTMREEASRGLWDAELVAEYFSLLEAKRQVA